MATPDLDTQCAAAMARITASVNRTAWALHHLFAVQQPPQPRRTTTPTQPNPGA